MHGYLVLAFFIFGVGSLLGGVFFLIKHLRIKMKGITTNAKIVDYRKKIEGDNDLMYYPIVEFIDSNNKLVNKQLEPGRVFKYDGDNIDIIYLKRGENYDVLINSFLGFFFKPLVMCIVGLACLALSFNSFEMIS